MTDQSLRRADELLTELVELVETARTLPMSSSIVVPRERVLDILDELRETMPPEMLQARRTLDTRDQLLHDAFEQAERERTQAHEEAEALLADARERAEATVREADAHAGEIIEAGRTEHARLVSATTVHQQASRAAEKLRVAAEELLAEARDRAERDAAALRSEVESYAAKLTADAEGYTDRTLAELAERLTHAAGVAEHGRVVLARRRAEAQAHRPAKMASSVAEILQESEPAESATGDTADQGAQEAHAGS